MTSRAGTGSKFLGIKYLSSSLSLGQVIKKIGSSLMPLKFFELFLSLVELVKKLTGLGQELGPGSIGYLAYLMRAFFQAWSFEPGRVPIPAQGSASTG